MRFLPRWIRDLVYRWRFGSEVIKDHAKLTGMLVDPPDDKAKLETTCREMHEKYDAWKND